VILETSLKDPKTGNAFECRIDYGLDDYFPSADPDAKPSGQEATIFFIDVEPPSDNCDVWLRIWEWDRYGRGDIPSAVWDSLKKQAIEAVEDSIKPDEQEAPDDQYRAEYYREKRIDDALEARE
jgi:hypothetical protein